MTDWMTVDAGGHSMSCYVRWPDGPGPFPAAVVCVHAPGVDTFIQGRVNSLAEHGFAAIAPDLFHRDPNPDDDPLVRMGRLRDEQILIDLTATTGFMREQARVARDRIGVIGFCMGGRVAYLHAATDPALRAAVVFYGGNIMRAWGAGPAPFDRTGQINCPVLGLFGNEDTNPSPADVAAIAAALSHHGKIHEFHRYDGCGHAFLNDSRPSYRAGPAGDAWDKCLDWLERYLH